MSELLTWLDEQEARGARHHRLDVRRAFALAMLGRFDEARSIMADVRAKRGEAGGDMNRAVLCGSSMYVELLAGDPEAAADFGRESMRLWDQFREQGFASGTAAGLAQACYGLGRLDEAERWANRAGELGASDDRATQMIWRHVKAKVVARRGDHAEAERLAREAVAIGEETDSLNSVADAYADLGEVLALAGRPDEAAAAFAEALARYERKENLVMAERTRARLIEAPA